MEKIIEIIEYENESHRVDFKKLEYNLGRDIKRNEILKDFLSFANHLSDDEKYIIIGIKEKDNQTKEITGIETATDEAKYRQFINEYIEPEINFEYHNFEYDNKTICYFKIVNNNNRPYLFKKDCKNPVDGKTEFKYGDGYMRVGTSTKKIGRKEIEDINMSKLKYINRHNDIEIKPIIGNSDNINVSKWNIKYLDIEIINKSNKSMDLDIELTIKKSNNYALLTDTDFLREIEEDEIKRKKTNSNFPIFTPINPIIPNIHIYTKETDEVFIIERNPGKQKFGITIAQNSTYSDVFLQSIVVLQNTDNHIEAEVVVRSDEFTNGPLKKNIIFET